VDAEPELLVDEPVRLPREDDARAEPPARIRGGHGRHGRWWLVLVLVLVVGAGAATVDARTRSHETSRVASCETRLRLATGYVERRLGLVNNYLEPSLTAAGQVQELHLADLMSTRAHWVLPRVQRADRFCRTVIVRPWHFSLASRQSASTAYSAALVTLVQLVAAQGHVPFRPDATLLRLRHQVGIDGG
jgi:hypothetical protein